MKEKGLAHWLSPNTGADNSSGFTALPGGARYVNCCSLTPVLFIDIGNIADWWSTSISSSSPDAALFIEANYNTTDFYRSFYLGGVGYYDKRTGYAVRCVKN